MANIHPRHAALPVHVQMNYGLSHVVTSPASRIARRIGFEASGFWPQLGSGSMPEYDPKSAHLVSFYEARRGFVDGADTPHEFLERCIKTIEEREPDVQVSIVSAAAARLRPGSSWID